MHSCPNCEYKSKYQRCVEKHIATKHASTTKIPDSEDTEIVPYTWTDESGFLLMNKLIHKIVSPARPKMLLVPEFFMKSMLKKEFARYYDKGTQTE